MFNKRVEWFRAGTDFDDDPLVLLEPSKFSTRVLKDIQGFDAPVFSFESLATPGIDGVRFGSVTATRPVLSVPVLVIAPTRAEMRRMKSQIVAAMNPKLGAGRLVMSEDIGSESGDVRFVECQYRGGLEGDGANGGTSLWWKFTAQFECSDPYWYSTEPATARWVGQPGKPTFPFTLAGNGVVMNPWGVILDELLELSGDAETFGTYTLSGPWSRARFVNDRTGKWWEITRDPNVTETLVVRTKPGTVGLRTVDGLNRYASFTKGANMQLFSLLPGDTISVECDGASGATAFDLSVPIAWNTAP